ncbi:Uncharacterized protein APZ42_024342 [Daphnia magna]|uniref:Uncharacterized protein n=1 Tax=Daphnia magna TaxID=35525 RepID=A0A0P5DEY4_9CRUS|nr:Uncharacterized protein APZ42_024342 [Daphnia magna]
MKSAPIASELTKNERFTLCQTKASRFYIVTEEQKENKIKAFLLSATLSQ